MLVEQFVLDTLLQDSRVTSLVGNRSYALLPQFDPALINYPAIVFRLSDREREYSHDGVCDSARSHFEIICVGQKYIDAVQAANAVRKAFNRSEGTYGTFPDTLKVFAVEVEGEEDLAYAPEELQDLSLFARGLGLLIAHTEDF